MNLASMAQRMIATHKEWQLQQFGEYVASQIGTDRAANVAAVTAYTTVLFLERGGVLVINETEYHAIAPLQTEEPPQHY